MISGLIIPSKYFLKIHCVEYVSILSFSGPYFPSFGLNMERYRVSLHIQSECKKIRTRNTRNTDIFSPSDSYSWFPIFLVTSNHSFFSVSIKCFLSIAIQALASEKLTRNIFVSAMFTEIETLKMDIFFLLHILL